MALAWGEDDPVVARSVSSASSTSWKWGDQEWTTERVVAWAVLSVPNGPEAIVYVDVDHKVWSLRPGEAREPVTTKAGPWTHIAVGADICVASDSGKVATRKYRATLRGGIRHMMAVRDGYAFAGEAVLLTNERLDAVLTVAQTVDLVAGAALRPPRVFAAAGATVFAAAQDTRVPYHLGAIEVGASIICAAAHVGQDMTLVCGVRGTSGQARLVVLAFAEGGAGGVLGSWTLRGLHALDALALAYHPAGHLAVLSRDCVRVWRASPRHVRPIPDAPREPDPGEVPAAATGKPAVSPAGHSFAA